MKVAGSNNDKVNADNSAKVNQKTLSKGGEHGLESTQLFRPGASGYFKFMLSLKKNASGKAI